MEILMRKLQRAFASSFLVTSCTLIASTLAAGQSLGALSIEDALKARSFGQLLPISLTPDGKWLAYTVRESERGRGADNEMSARTGIHGWNTGTDIWISNTGTGETRNLTGGKDDNFLPVWSPDGHYLAFLSDRDGSGQARLWIWDAKQNDLRRASDIDTRGNQVVWTADSRKVLVATLPEGLSVEEYVKRQTFRPESHEPTFAKAPGSTVVLYQANRGPSENKEAQKSDPWNLDLSLVGLASVDVTTGKTEMLIKGQRIARFLPSPDGLTVAYTTPKRFEKPGSQQIIYDLAIINIATKEVRVLAADIRLGFTGEFSWSPDGSQLTYRTFGMEEKANDCYVVDADGGSPRNVTMLAQNQDPVHISQRALWDPGGEHVYFIKDGALWRASAKQSQATRVAQVPDRTIIQMISQSGNSLWVADEGKSTIVLTDDDGGRQDGFYKVDLSSGASTKLLEKGQCYACGNLAEGQFAVVTMDGRNVTYFAEDAEHESDLWIADSSFKNPKRVTNLNPQFEKHKMGSARLIDWLSEDGERLRGILVLPSGYQVGKRYPLVVWVYGGVSLSENFNRFGLAYGGPFNLQLFATRGYAVLLPDAPQHLGTPMSDLAKTVLPGVNKVIEMGIVDPDRLGVAGHSYGGYSTMSLIVQTTRFKAAMEADSFADLIGFYGQMGDSGDAFGISLLEKGQGLMGGTPWEYRERYIENSPISYLDRIDTPLLIVHGSKDGIASFLGDQIFVGLRRLGKEVEYAKYEGEGHSPVTWTYSNQLDFCNRMIAWFGEHLKKSQ
jgi:dipeptidyl aminopeptidase/acylaminoacyl peptidase